VAMTVFGEAKYSTSFLSTTACSSSRHRPTAEQVPGYI